ncbi:MAG: DUF4097 domain-containing protein [Clostridia bacterium]|nr:DUF4097 domain-containing protein [Clostridia bacterium]MDE6471525.1 DUF4097 domain-containing protein [Clostridia bacterium]
MKGFVKVIIAGAVLLVVGVVILVIALGIYGWQIDDDYDMKNYECTEQNTILDIDFSAGTLEINYYDGEKIKIEYPENKNLSASIVETNGKLSFTTTTKRKWNIFNWFNKIPTAKIWIPQGEIIDIDLDMNAGVTKVAEAEFGNFNIKMNAGTLQMDNATCKKMSVDMNAGTINVKDVVSAEAIRIDLSAGALSIQSLVCPSLVGDISAGSVNISRLQTASVDFDISAGAVKLGMIGAKSDYNIAIQKSAGSSNITNQSGNKDLRIKANISAGSLNVSFES